MTSNLLSNAFNQLLGVKVPGLGQVVSVHRDEARRMWLVNFQQGQTTYCREIPAEALAHIRGDSPASTFGQCVEKELIEAGRLQQETKKKALLQAYTDQRTGMGTNSLGINNLNPSRKEKQM